MSRPDSWMPLYIGDYLADTGRLTTEGHGAYLLLLMEYWRCGEPLPDDDEQLACIARLPADRWGSLRGVLARFFEVGDGAWRHKRVERELFVAQERYSKTKARSDAANAAKQARKAASDETFKDTSKETKRASLEEPQPQPQPHSPKGENGDTNVSPRGTKSEPHGSRIPADWALTDDLRAYAMQKGLTDHEAEREAEKFKLHWTAKAGAAGRKRDWLATWQTWVIKTLERKHEQRRSSPKQPTGFAAIAQREFGLGLGGSNEADDGW